jgi:L-seryl-tRNA(Ser) seleniumtransferase
VPRWALVAAARVAVYARRQQILEGAADSGEIDPAGVAADARRRTRPSLRRVINATGVVLHTNLGRAPLAPEALAALADVAAYSNLEYDLEAGERGSRHGHLVDLVSHLSGAEDACAVNNNAGATMLALAALAAGREVIVSRGELVEIGGSFRVPDVMKLSGAVLVEVGTTNKTRIADYAAAIGERTALMLKVHRSNFEIVGFAEETPCAEIAALGRERGVATMYDLGSGSLLSAAEMAELGLPAEPGVREAIKAGLDVVTFSGDKLLGGPQAGILAGSRGAIAACRKHPLMRALRPDKLTIGALAATLSLYRDGDREKIPALAMLGARLERLHQRAEALRDEIADRVDGSAIAPATRMVESAVGGGAMPSATLPSWAIGLVGISPEVAAAGLRRAPVPVIGRVIDDVLVLDVRTVAASDEADLVAAVASLVARSSAASRE